MNSIRWMLQPKVIRPSWQLIFGEDSRLSTPRARALTNNGRACFGVIVDVIFQIGLLYFCCSGNSRCCRCWWDLSDGMNASVFVGTESNIRSILWCNWLKVIKTDHLKWFGKSHIVGNENFISNKTGKRRKTTFRNIYAKYAKNYWCYANAVLGQLTNNIGCW